MVCRCKKPLDTGARRIALTIDWGDDDARADWKGEKVFCSFACARDWLADMVVEHDGRVV